MTETPENTPVPGESAPLHEQDAPDAPDAPATSQLDDEDEAANPHGRILSGGDDDGDS